MLNHNSAVEREENPHATNSTQNANSTKPDTLGSYRCITIAYRRRAESVINDRSIDVQTRTLIRYAPETSDPWVAELLRRVRARHEISGAAGPDGGARRLAPSESSGEHGEASCVQSLRRTEPVWDGRRRDSNSRS
jgi:hypothetical protein